MIRFCLLLVISAICINSAEQETPKLEFFCQLNVKIEKPIVIGEVPLGTRRVIPIVGGSVNGPAIKGEIMNVGADWQIVRKDGVAELEALYQFKTDDGVIIFIRNLAKRVATPEVAEKISRGEKVDVSQYYFRGTPKFEAPPGKYAWINDTVFICTGERLPGSVLINVWRVF
ncbi:MAG: DUF3237 domain-containing protein [Bacteroidota bacterium]